MGNLLHKLTKYQTLFQNTQAREKQSLYAQKINQYKNKLESMGINKTNLTQFGGTGTEGLTNLINKKIDEIKQKLANKVSVQHENAPTNKIEGINDNGEVRHTRDDNGTYIDASGSIEQKTVGARVEEVIKSIDETKINYNNTITDLSNLLRILLNYLAELEKQIASINTSGGDVDLSKVHAAIIAIKQRIDGLVTENVVQDKYLESFIKDYIARKDGSNKMDNEEIIKEMIQYMIVGNKLKEDAKEEEETDIVNEILTNKLKISNENNKLDNLIELFKAKRKEYIQKNTAY